MIFLSTIASPEETSLINSHKTEISEAARNFGIDLNLDKLPVILTSKKNLLKDPYSGFCIPNKAIVILKEAIMVDVLRRNSREKDEVAPGSFSLFLHEVGHCYFNRGHESEILSRNGYQLRIKQGNQNYDLDWVTASIMNNRAGTAIPDSLKKYYLAEIFGIYRAKNLNDIAEFIGASIVPTN